MSAAPPAATSTRAATFAYPPYDELRFEVPVLAATATSMRGSGFASARSSRAWPDRPDSRAPAGGPIRVEPPRRRRRGEGLALVEGFRGDVLAGVRLDGEGRVARCHLRDPSWFQWPLLEAAIEGNIVADFPLCNKSFNCSYSGHDL